VTGSKPADVTIHARREGGYTHLEFTASKTGVEGFNATLSTELVATARKELDKGLTNLKYRLPGLHVDAKYLDEVHTELTRLSFLILSTLFGGRRDQQGMQRFWARAMPFGRASDYQPLIEYVGDMDSQLPVEFIPLYFYDQSSTITSADDFIRACRAFLGFYCIVRRHILPNPLPSNLALSTLSDNRLPIRYLYFEDLRGAKEELSWFTSSAAHRVEIEGPYPSSQKRLPSLAQQIFDPTLLLAGGRRAVPDQVLHFACHCSTSETDSSDNAIELSGNGTSIRATLSELKTDLSMLAYRPAETAGDLPLVFMNACGSARLLATASTSFPSLFLDNGNRGFIGTEVEMPDYVAAAFSKAFYERFLLWGRPLGNSVLDARNYLLQEYCNPLGIAYTTYADPETYIRPASAGPAPGDKSNVATVS
jgi:CHAT domain